MGKSKTITCYLCGTKLSKDEIGLNRKLHGRQVSRFYCLSCFAEYLDSTVEELLCLIEDFKAQGCSLFE